MLTTGHTSHLGDGGGHREAPVVNARRTIPLHGWDDATVIVEILDRPAPPAIPEQLIGLIAPVRFQGRLDDWELDGEALDEIAEATDREQVRATYTAWRRTWRPARELGAATSVEQFLRFAVDAGNELGVTLPTLAAVNLDGDRIEPARAARLIGELKVAAAFVRETDVKGWMMLDTERKTPVRYIAPLGRAWTIHRFGAYAATVDDGGLVLTGDGRERHLASWGLGTSPAGTPGAGLWAVDTAGTEHRITGDAARLLQQLSPGSSRIRMRRAPLTSIWAACLTHLPETLAQAGEHPVVIRPR
jgi:hypothetical protein